MSFGRLERPTGDKPMSDINVTPLVDVMLVLLVIFMVTVPAVSQTNVLSLPHGSPDTTLPAQSVRLRLTAGDLVEWNGEALSLPQLQSRMEAAARAAGANAMAQPKLEVFADDGADYALLTQVLARASNAGLVRVTLADTP